MRLRWFVVVATLCLSLTAAAAEARHPLSLDDLPKLRSVSDPQLSPDGRWIAYTVSAPDVEKDRRDTDLWMVGWNGEDRIRLTSLPESSESKPRWSPDGRYLAFVATRGDEAEKKKGGQVWLLDRRGGEAQKLTDLNGGVSDLAWSPDGKRLVLVVSDFDPSSDPEKKEGWKRKTAPPIVIDRYHFKEDGDGYLGSLRSHLQLFDVEAKTALVLTAGLFDERNPSWSPDGRLIAFVSDREKDQDRIDNSDLFVIEPKAGAEARRVTTFAGPDRGRPSWSPDGQFLAYLQGDEPKYSAYMQNKLAIVPVAGGAARVLTTSLDRAVQDPILWSADGKSLTFVVQDDRITYVGRMPVAGGAVEKLTTGRRVVSSLSPRKDGALAMLMATASSPDEVAVFENGNLRTVTHENDAWLANVQLATVEDFTTRAKDGNEVHGLLFKPPASVAGQKYPTLLNIHGGPNSQDQHAFSFERQFLAANGYAVLAVNYRGSAGRGSAYQKAIFADWGNKEVLDLLAAVDHAVASGVADPARLGIGGWSYGGILTDYTIATDSRFKGAISGAGSALQLSMYGSDEYVAQYELELGPPWKSVEPWLKVSYPFLHADRIKTPTLFLGGASDFNVPIIGGEQMYQALRSLDVDTQLVVYPGQHHGITTPSYVRDRLERYVGWFDKYVKNGKSTPSASTSSTSTLTFQNASADPARRLTLRRDGARIVVVDDDSHAVVAGAPAAATRRVVIRGASAAHDDTLTVDLAGGLSLPDGIDYDGGAAGWDTLVVRGGAVRHETVTQLTPHDGVFDLDGLAIRYTNLEPLTDTASAATLTVIGTAGADTVTVSDGPGGTTTISSPTFESVTFANKTNVTFDGLGGGDTVTLANPNPATGLTNFFITNVATVSQTAAEKYPGLGISATGTIYLPDAANDSDSIEMVTQSGNLIYSDADDVTIGGLSASLTGLHVATAGNIQLTTNGTITLADTDGAEIIGGGATSGNVFVQSLGFTSDIAVTVDKPAVTAPAGSVTVIAGHDLLLGTAGNYDNDVRAATSVALVGNHDAIISGQTNVLAGAFGGTTGGTLAITANHDLLLSDTTGGGATAGANGTSGSVSLAVGNGVLSITADNTAAVFSTSSAVSLLGTRFVLDAGSGISSPVSVRIAGQTLTNIDLGSSADLGPGLDLSDAEIDRINTPSLTVAVSDATLTVSQPITFSGSSLTLTRNASPGTFTATGSGSLSAPTLTLNDQGFGPRTYAIDPSSVTISPGAPIPYTGVTTLNVFAGIANDTFSVTPSPSTLIHVEGNTGADPLSVNLAGTTSPHLSFAPSGSGYTGTYTFGNRQPVEFVDVDLVTATTDLAITKTDGATTETPGTTVTYTIVATNNGPLGMSGIAIDDSFPPSLSAINWTCTPAGGATCTASGSGALHQVVDLPLGASVTYSVTATISASASGTLTNTATIAPPAGATDSNLANNSATDSDALITNADLSVTKTSTATGYTAGGTISYAIAVTNAGPNTAASVTLTDALPANTTFNALTAPAGFSCTTPAVGAPGTVTCTNGALPVGTSTFTLVVNVSGSASTPIANTATVSTTSTDANPANNTSTFALSNAVEIPTLSEVALLLLAAALGLAAMLMMRRG